MNGTINSVDLFCGAGGAETGLSLALRDLGLKKRGLAINHWQVAVDTLAANHGGDTRALNMDLMAAVPSEVAQARRIDILWASPTCTHHSRAKGGKPLDSQMRAQPELIITWLDQLNVIDLCVENVPEFTGWGPLLASGRPDQRRKGACFRAWFNSIEARGYKVEWRILNCADYGDATTRRRFFLRARKCSYIGRFGPIVWPEQTHTDAPNGGLFGLKPWRGIIDCLDLSDLGRSIFQRKKPLAEKTMRRILAGIAKFHGTRFQLDVMGAGGGHGCRLKPLSYPIPAQTAANRVAVVKPIVVRLNKGCDATSSEAPLPTVTAGGGHYMLVSLAIYDYFRGAGFHRVTDPLPSQTCKTRCAMVSAVMDMSHPGEDDHGARVRLSSEPVGTITATRNHALVTAFLADYHFNNGAQSLEAPMPAATAVRNHALVSAAEKDGVLVDILVRMLKPSEIAAAHSFPSDYVMTGTVADKVRQIGNSVPVETARAICRAVFAGRRTPTA